MSSDVVPIYLKCFSNTNYTPPSKCQLSELEVYYAQTKDICSESLHLKKFIPQVELLRSTKFHFDKDRETYIACHALLRLILSKKLNIKPLKIHFFYDINNKPVLDENYPFFNITHTRDAFAFAIHKYSNVGIDLEKINQNVDFKSITEKYFSNKERQHILGSQANTRDRFFLLWTRKEAFLKALGIGILNDLTKVEVCEEENIINVKPFQNLVLYPINNVYFIYSKKVGNYYLSTAVPQMAEIIFYQIKKENIHSYINR